MLRLDFFYFILYIITKISMYFKIKNDVLYIKMLQKNKTEDEIIFFPKKMQMLLTCEDMDLYIRYMCMFKSSKHFFDGGIVNGIMLHIVCEGEGVIECNNVKYNVNKNKMLVIWPNDFIKYNCTLGPWWYKWIWLAGTKSQSILNKMGITPDNPFFDISSCNNLLERLDETADIFKSGNHSVFFPIQAAWNIIDALEKDIGVSLSFVSSDNIAELCRILIENKPDSFSSVNDLAEHFKVDRSTIFRIFKASFNISPKEYIEKVRFEKACQLLSISEMKIKEISNICGYENQCYFSAAFQKRFGISPSQWRQKQ